MPDRLGNSPHGSGSGIGFTMLPNVLLDEIMPTLGDTQWRVLCVVARQTLGWKGPGTSRKRRDWLSQAQLTKRTGRNTKAVSEAVDALVRRGLIEATDGQDAPLHTPQARRACRKRVYYGLAEWLWLASAGSGLNKTPVAKGRTIKETEDKTKTINKEAVPQRERSQHGAYAGWERAGAVIERNTVAARH